MIKKAANTDRWMMYFSIIDILFLPYCFIITVTYSFIPIIWWYENRKHVLSRTNKDFYMYKKMCFFLWIGALVGIILDFNSTWNNISLTLQFIVCFMRFYVFKYYFDTYGFELKKILMAFAAFAALFALIFIYDIGLYFELRRIWSPVQSSSDSEFITSIIRYGFLWMDENNIAYMMNAIMLFVICNEKSELYEKLFVIACTFLVVMCSMSRGGMLSFYTGLSFYMGLRLTGNGVKRTFKNKKMLVSILFCMIFCGALIKYAPSYFQSEVAQNSRERLDDHESDNRKAIYTKILTQAPFYQYAIFGHGTNITLNGKPIKPHSIHFYWIFAYGFIAYFYMMYIIFRKRKVTKWMEYIWIWPYFLGTTINIIIGEEKAMSIGFLLLAASISPKYLKERRC